ncbi:MAG: hypothetical protein M0019_10190 [Actinomycetota bacterium]|nr:hypothetical protein [Actinomycetota bacterium]
MSSNEEQMRANPKNDMSQSAADNVAASELMGDRLPGAVAKVASEVEATHRAMQGGVGEEGAIWNLQSAKSKSGSSIEIGPEDDEEERIVVFAPLAKLLYGEGK